jgi:hypothetical protein
MAANLFHQCMTQLFAWRPAVQLVLCIVLANRGSYASSLPLQVLLTLLFYIAISTFLVLSLSLFIYLPLLSPLRSIPSPPRGHNTWQTWLAKEPTPPQLLDWVRLITCRFILNNSRAKLLIHVSRAGLLSFLNIQ